MTMTPRTRVFVTALFTVIAVLVIILGLGQLHELGAAHAESRMRAAYSIAVADPVADPNDGGFLGLLMTGKYMAAVGIALMSGVALVRATVLARVAFFQTKAGGYLLGFGSSALLYIGTALASSNHLTLGVVAAALGAGWVAAGGWEHVSDLLELFKKTPPASSIPKATATITGIAIIAIAFGAAVQPACSFAPVVAQDAINCAEQNTSQIEALVAEFLPLVTSGKVDWSVVGQRAEAAGKAVGACFIAELVQQTMGGAQALPHETGIQARSTLASFLARHNISVVHTKYGDAK